MRALFLSDEKTLMDAHTSNNKCFVSRLTAAFNEAGHTLLRYDYTLDQAQEIINNNNLAVVLLDVPSMARRKELKKIFRKIDHYPVVAIFRDESTGRMLKHDMGIKQKPGEGRRIVRISRDKGAGEIYALTQKMALQTAEHG